MATGRSAPLRREARSPPQFSLGAVAGACLAALAAGLGVPVVWHVTSVVVASALGVVSLVGFTFRMAS